MIKTKTKILPVALATRPTKPQIEVVGKIGNSAVAKQVCDLFELKFSTYIFERITSGNQITRFVLSDKDLQTIKNCTEQISKSNAALRAKLKRTKTELKATSDKLEAEKADRDTDRDAAKADLDAVNAKLEAAVKNGARWEDMYHQQERNYSDKEDSSDDDRPLPRSPNCWDLLPGKGTRLRKVSGGLPS